MAPAGGGCGLGALVRWSLVAWCHYSLVLQGCSTLHAPKTEAYGSPSLFRPPQSTYKHSEYPLAVPVLLPSSNHRYPRALPAQPHRRSLDGASNNCTICLISLTGGRPSSRDPRLPARDSASVPPPGLRLSLPQPATRSADSQKAHLIPQPRPRSLHAATQTSHLRAPVVRPALGVWHRARAVNCLLACCAPLQTAAAAARLQGSPSPASGVGAESGWAERHQQYKISRNPASPSIIPTPENSLIPSATRSLAVTWIRRLASAH